MLSRVVIILSFAIMKGFGSFLSYLILQISILFCFKPKIFILAHPTHANLGDQAQLMCLHDWLKENFPHHQIFNLGTFTKSLFIYKPLSAIYFSLLFFTSYLVLKLKVKPDDLFIGHSGYLMIDHHPGWKMFVDIARFFPKNRLVIFPQTINFSSLFIQKFVSSIFNTSSNIVLMCRDEVSLLNAKKLFPKTRLLLMPDIVTTLIGTKSFPSKRNGVLFCLRNDLEAFYKESEIERLVAKFSDYPVTRNDTTIDIPENVVNKNRSKLVWEMIDVFAKHQVAITDRYHGTIFSVIAATPVVVVNSTDHKLSSGVKWFPKEFSEYVHFANDLEEAYLIAKSILQRGEVKTKPPRYFKDVYYSDLISKL